MYKKRRKHDNNVNSGRTSVFNYTLLSERLPRKVFFGQIKKRFFVFFVYLSVIDLTCGIGLRLMQCVIAFYDLLRLMSRLSSSCAPREVMQTKTKRTDYEKQEKNLSVKLLLKKFKFQVITIELYYPITRRMGGDRILTFRERGAFCFFSDVIGSLPSRNPEELFPSTLCVFFSKFPLKLHHACPRCRYPRLDFFPRF